MLIINKNYVNAWFYTWQVTTLTWTFTNSGNKDAPLLLNWVYFNLAPLNTYYTWKKVSVTVKWNSTSSFNVLSILEKQNTKIENLNTWWLNQTIDLSTREEKSLTLKEKLLLLRKNIKSESLPIKVTNTNVTNLTDLFWDLSSKNNITISTPKTLKEKLFELQQLKEKKEKNIDLKLKNFVWS